MHQQWHIHSWKSVFFKTLFKKQKQNIIIKNIFEKHGVQPPHFSFQHVFETLKEKQYITQDCGDQLDVSMEVAAKEYLQQTKNVTEREKKNILQDNKRLEEFTQAVALGFLEIH